MVAMAKVSGRSSKARFAAYVEKLTGVIGHADRAGPLRDYCTGLLMPAERKSVEPMAAVTAPARVAAQHQSLLHFVANAPWSDEAMLAKVREIVLPEMTRTEPVAAWIIDDTGFPKKGRHSVGVGRQYCGQLGKQDNCQVAVSLSLANHAASLPVSYRLYLPRDWAEDPARRAKAGVPEEIAFRTKPEIALDLLRAAAAAGLPPAPVVTDAGYGKDTGFRTGVSALGLSYVAAVLSSTTVWPPGTGPLPPKPWSGRGRRATRLRRDAQHQPVPVKAVALGLPETAWTEIAWREGTNGELASRFARTRVRAAHADTRLSAPRDEEWLLIEWPEGEPEPTQYWLSTLPEEIGFEQMVDLAQLRWRIERDYQDLKQEVGLGHYEGRGWRGFHHHATLCIAAYGFLIAERARFSPSGPSRAGGRAGGFEAPRLSEGYRPRGAPDPTRAARPELDRHRATTAHRGAGPEPASMPVLRTHQSEKSQPTRLPLPLVTQ
jgi:SRSO17 transposase